jgi:hypothetical protein
MTVGHGAGAAAARQALNAAPPGDSAVAKPSTISRWCGGWRAAQRDRRWPPWHVRAGIQTPAHVPRRNRRERRRAPHPCQTRTVSPTSLGSRAPCRQATLRVRQPSLRRPPESPRARDTAPASVFAHRCRRGRRPTDADQRTNARSAHIVIQGRSRHHGRGSFATRRTADNGVPFHHQLVPRSAPNGRGGM